MTALAMASPTTSSPSPRWIMKETWPGVCPKLPTASIPGRISAPASNSSTLSSIAAIRLRAPTTKLCRASGVAARVPGARQ